MKKLVTILLLSFSLVSCTTGGNEPTTPPVVEKTYTVTWKNYNDDVLETDTNVKEGTMPHYDGADPVRPDDDAYTYTWTGWTPTLKAVTTDQVYKATFSSTEKTTTYTITYNLAGGTNSANNPSTYESGSSFTFSDPSKTGFKFEGWYDANGNKVTGITEDTKGNLVLTAHWTPLLNTLSVTSEDEAKGTVEIVFGSGYSDEDITVKATPANGYIFDGWYLGNNKISSSETYTFTMPTSDYTLVARFIYDEERAIKLGMIPHLSSDRKTMTYGIYPQKNVNDSATITELN